MESKIDEDYVFVDANLTDGSTEGASSYPTLPPEDASEVCCSARFQDILDQRSGDQFASAVEADIEASRVTCSKITVVDVDAEDEEDIAESNKRVFEELRQCYPRFFKASNRIVVLGDRVAAGAQADIFTGFVQWADGSWHDNAWAYKVYRLDRASALRHLQESIPQGMLSNVNNRTGCYFEGNLWGAFLLEDARIAFRMQRMWGDLRKFIDLKMLNRGPPFSNVAAYCYMRDIARDMERLHNHNIVHRDVKAANVLVEWPEFWTGKGPRSWKEVRCQVADIETSANVIGTQFHRAPEILRAIDEARRENRSVDLDVVTKSADVYSYGVTCYEILTGRVPFEGHRVSEYEPVYSGRMRLQWPRNLEREVKQLLERCTSLLPSERPTFEEICRVLLPFVRHPFTW